MGKGKKGKKGGKKKKSKEAEEAERLAREEEERIRLEAEQQRLAEERIEKEKRDKEQVEEAGAKRAEELSRLRREEDDNEAERENQIERTNLAVLKRMGEDDWVSYTQCSHRPQVTSKADLNTYLNEWSKGKETNLGNILAECQESVMITRSIENFLTSTYFHISGSVAEREEYVKYLHRFRAAEIRKLDQATAHILHHPTDYATPKNEVFVYESSENGDVKYGLWSNLASKGFRVKTIDFPDMNVVVEIPKALALQSIAVRVILFNRESDLDQVYPSDEVVVGSCLTIEVLQMPPPSKHTRGWTIRPRTMFSDTVQRIFYPLGAPGETAGLPPVGGTNSNTVSARFKIPETVVVENNFTRLSCLDRSHTAWVQGVLQDVEINTETGWISYNTTALSPVSLLQSKTLDFPLKTWSLIPFPDGRVQVTFKGNRWDIVVEVSDGLCSLAGPCIPALGSLIGTRLQPGKLLDLLAIRGINLRATSFEPDKAPWRKDAKSASIEQEAYKAIGMLAGAMEIVPSSWNLSVSKDSVCFKVKEGSILAEATAQPPAAASEADVPMYTVLVERDDELRHGVKFRVVSEEKLEECLSPHELLTPSARLNLGNIESSIELGELLMSQGACSTESYRAALDAGPLQHTTIAHLLSIVCPLNTCFEASQEDLETFAAAVVAETDNPAEEAKEDTSKGKDQSANTDEQQHATDTTQGGETKVEESGTSDQENSDGKVPEPAAELNENSEKLNTEDIVKPDAPGLDEAAVAGAVA